MASFGFPGPGPATNLGTSRRTKPVLALEFDVKTSFEAKGGFFTEDGDEAIGDSADLSWVGSSGTRGLQRCSLPLLGANDAPADYNVRIHFASSSGAPVGRQVCDVKLQGETVLEGFDVAVEADDSQQRVVREFSNVKVTDSLLLELVAKNTSGDATSVPVVCAIEVQRIGNAD